MRSRVKELARRRRGQQEAATIWTRCQTKRWRRMVGGQQDLPGVRPGPAPPTPSTPSPLPSLLRSGQLIQVDANFASKALSAAAGGSGRGAAQGFQGFQGVTGLGPAAARFFLLPCIDHHNMCFQTSGLRLEDLQLQLLPAPQPGLPQTCSRLPCFRFQWHISCRMKSLMQSSFLLPHHQP